MEWFLSGSNLVADLPESVQKWWTPWANEHGCVANNYSSQFRAFAGAPNGDHVAYCDQIEYLIESLKSHPNSRRAVITSWNTADMASSHTPITNCHGTVIQCFVDSRDNVDMFMYQRSADMVVGTPHNWIQYWALLQYLAHRAGRQPGKFTWMGGDCHIYEDHVDLVKRMLEVCNEDDDALGPTASPQLIYTPSSDEFLASDFSLDAPYAPAITESAKMVV
jgi:thymidylate synthase